jgi:scyllo-inositol 2-dehydrogenase (NADP+)
MEGFVGCSMINIGLIGFGLAGRAFHAQVIRRVPGLRLAAILQRHGSEAADTYPDVCVVRTLKELLAVPDVRLIVIATPNDSHFSLAEQCLTAGRDVLVDKPFTDTLGEAQTLVQLAKAKNLVLTVYQNRRFDGDFQTVLQIVKSGQLGRIVSFEANYDRYRPQLRPGAWRETNRPGAGIFFDIGPHLIDYALTLFGMPEAVTADIRIQRDAAMVDDTFDVALHYSGGLRADLRSSILAAAPRPHLVLHGIHGSFVKQTVDPQELNLRYGKIPEKGPWGAEPEQDWGILTLAQASELTHRRVPSVDCDYRVFYANLRDALLGEAELLVAPKYALDVMFLLEVCRQSSHERRTIALRAAAQVQLSNRV